MKHELEMCPLVETMHLLKGFAQILATTQKFLIFIYPEW